MKKLLLVTLPLFAVAAVSADNTAYWTTTDDAPLRDSQGDCVITSQWQTSAAIDGCGEVPEDPIEEIRHISLSAATSFEFDSAKLRVDAIDILDDLAVKIIRLDDLITSISIHGHTDSTGEADYNLRLSKERAEAVSTYLIEQGVNADLITTAGFGETQPIADNSTMDGRRANRRVDIQVDGI